MKQALRIAKGSTTRAELAVILLPIPSTITPLRDKTKANAAKLELGIKTPSQ